MVSQMTTETHCRNGHRRTDANTYTYPGGLRWTCKTCQKKTHLAYKKERHEARGWTAGQPWGGPRVCRNGHRRTKASTYTSPSGQKQCHTCKLTTDNLYNQTR